MVEVDDDVEDVRNTVVEDDVVEEDVDLYSGDNE